AMAKRPEERFATAADFAQAIRAAPTAAIAPAAAVEEGTIVAPKVAAGRVADATARPARSSAAAPLVATAGRSRLPLWIGAVVVLVIVVGGGLWLFAFRPAPGSKSELVAAAGSNSGPRAAIAAAEAPKPAHPAPSETKTPPAAPASAASNTGHAIPAQHAAAATPASPSQSAASTTPQSAPAATAPSPAPSSLPPSSLTASSLPASSLPKTAASAPVTSAAAPKAASPAPAPPPPTTASPPPANAEPAPVAAPLPVPPPQPPASAAAPQPAPAAETASQTPAPAPSAPTQLANIPASPEAIAKAVASAIAPVPCSLVSGSVATAGSITLAGLAGDQAPSELHQALADAAPSAAVNWGVSTFSGGAAAIYCRALDLLRPIATPFSASGPTLQLVLQSGKPVLVDGDPIAFRVGMPRFPAWLSVDYFSSDGTVAHLAPGPGNPAQSHRADTVVLVQHNPPWTAGPPYGHDMIVAIASAKPLFATARPETEQASAFLPALAAALDAARSAGTHLEATALLLETHAKH
ncbi:MAG: DUF4384 domain-containing protein, partial [Acetobacteraceae bacterium]